MFAEAGSLKSGTWFYCHWGSGLLSHRKPGEGGRHTGSPCTPAAAPVPGRSEAKTSWSFNAPWAGSHLGGQEQGPSQVRRAPKSGHLLKAYASGTGPTSP